MSELAVIPQDPTVLDVLPDPAAAMVALVDQARTMLAQATGMEGLADVIEWKSRAEAIRVYTQQKDMGHEAELSAQEIVRRAERRIGQLIREGQEAGDIMTDHEARRLGGLARHQLRPDDTQQKPSRTSLVGQGTIRTDVAAMTEGVTDEQFDAAVDEAKAEGNLSRSNVVRKVKNDPISRLKQAAKDNPVTLPRNMPLKDRGDQIRALAEKGYSSFQIGERIGISDGHVRTLAKRMEITIPGDAGTRNTHKHDPNRIVEEAAITLEGLALSISLVGDDPLDPARVEQWATSFESSLRSLNRFHKHMKEMARVQQ